MLNAVKNNFKSFVSSAELALIGLMYGQPVHASTMSIESATINSGMDADTMVSGILGIIIKIATYIGSALLIWGLVMFGLAIKNDEPESKQKALMTAFAGVVLIAIRSVLQAIGVIS